MEYQISLNASFQSIRINNFERIANAISIENLFSFTFENKRSVYGKENGKFGIFSP